MACSPTPNPCHWLESPVLWEAPPCPTGPWRDGHVDTDIPRTCQTEKGIEGRRESHTVTRTWVGCPHWGGTWEEVVTGRGPERGWRGPAAGQGVPGQQHPPGMADRPSPEPHCHVTTLVSRLPSALPPVVAWGPYDPGEPDNSLAPKEAKGTAPAQCLLAQCRATSPSGTVTI